MELQQNLNKYTNDYSLNGQVNKSPLKTSLGSKNWQKVISQQVQKDESKITNHKTQSSEDSNSKDKNQVQNNKQIPLLLSEQSFKQGNKAEQFKRQTQMMEEAARLGKQLLLRKQYLNSAKQLSKALMAFQFIAKNHSQIGKQQIKNMVISTVLPTYSNLALCNLKLKNYPLVLSFANQVLGQDPDNVKARYRRALANKQLNKTDEAIADFQIVKKLDRQMQEDCNEKIKLCKLMEIQLKKRRKLSAQKFLSGYQDQNDQQNSNLISKVEKELPINGQKIVKPSNAFLRWISETCSKLSNFMKRGQSNKNKEQQKQ